MKILFFYRISIKDNNLKLYIENISLTDRGRYQCQAENLAGRSQQIFDIQVYGKNELKQLQSEEKTKYSLF